MLNRFNTQHFNYTLVLNGLNIILSHHLNIIEMTFSWVFNYFKEHLLSRNLFIVIIYFPYSKSSI